MRTPASSADLAASLDLLARPGTAGWSLVVDDGRTGHWPRLADLARTDVWDPVAERVQARLGGCERRVADSLVLMGLAARLWYVTLVPAAQGLALLDPGALVVSDDDGALVLGVRGPSGWSGVTPHEVAEVVLAALEPVVAAVPLAVGLSWGNVASALLGVRGLAGRPVTGWVMEVLADDRLVGTLASDGRRRSCCLFYRVPGGGLCADCCLDRVPSGVRG